MIVRFCFDGYREVPGEDWERRPERDVVIYATDLLDAAGRLKKRVAGDAGVRWSALADVLYHEGWVWALRQED